MSPMLHLVPRPPDRNRARRNALAVAAAIGGRVSTLSEIVLNEPRCPFQIRWNTEDFWFGVAISDTAYVIRSNAKDRFSEPIRYFASLKTPHQAMLIDLMLPTISHELGVPVYSAEEQHCAAIEKALQGTQVRQLIDQLDFEAIEHFFFSPCQLRVVASMSTPEHCARQVTVLRQLQTALANVA